MDVIILLYREPSQGDYRLENKIFLGNISPLAFPDVVINVDQLLA